MCTTWEGDYLWLCLLALDFEPHSYDSSLVLGPAMFDKPNRASFHVVSQFLLSKLDQSRADEIFRNRFLIGSFTDSEFRKDCCNWLKDISREDQSCLPHVAPSSLIVPGGLKFIQLFSQLARYVVLQDMKRNYIGTSVPFAEAVMLSPVDVYMANARCRVACNKLLQVFQREDFVIQEYEKKEQLLIEEIEEIKSEYAVLQTQFWKMKQSDQNKNDKTEAIEKVRSLWTFIMEKLTSLKKEKEDVDSVLDEHKCILDGTNVVFRIPQLLVHRVGSDTHQLCTGNVYEAEKLNFLTVIQLLNEALRTLRDEHCQSEFKLQVVENMISHYNEALKDVTAKRLVMLQQLCVPASVSNWRKQEDWEVKWKNFLGRCPFNLCLEQNSTLDLLRYLSHSSNLGEDNEYTVFCQRLVSVSDVFDSIDEAHYEKNGTLETMMVKGTLPSKGTSSVPLELSKASEDREVLIEKNLPTENCKDEKEPLPPKILKSATSEMCKNTDDNVIQTEPPIKKDHLKKATDDLAEEVANAVMSESPQSSEEKGMALQDLVSLMTFDPFLTRKQIPRTPENLLTEIRSSWRKAIQTEGLSDTELAPAEATIEKSPMDATPVMQKVSDCKFMFSIPASPVSGFDSPLSERKAQLNSTKLKPQEQMRMTHIIEPSVSETSGMQEDGRIEAQELKYIVSNKSSIEDAEVQNFQYRESLNTSDPCSEDNSRTNVLPSDQFQSFLMEEVLQCSTSPLSFISHGAGCLGILDETFPEEPNSTDLSKFESSENSESDFCVIDSAYITDDSKNKGDIIMPKLNLQSPLNTYEVGRMAESRSKEDLHQTHNGTESVSSRSDPSLATEKRERHELSGSLQLFHLDEAFTKTPSPKSLNERKYSLSSVLVSCQHLEEMASMIHEIPLDLMHKMKDKMQLDEKLGTKEPLSGQNL